MKILVCISHVPDTTSKINFTDNDSKFDSNGVQFVINPYDEYAVEEALKTKEKFGDDSEVVVSSLGGDNSKETIRKALAMGIDSLSMSVSSLPRVKWVIRNTTRERARQILSEVLMLEDAEGIRHYLNRTFEDAGMGGLVRAGK